MRFAEEDLRTAESLLDDEELVPRHACWLAQQAAEKALKAGLVFHQIAHPFRHDLDALRNLLPEGWETKQEQPDLAELTEWAVEARYPGDSAEAIVDDARGAVAQARSVYESVRVDLAKRGLDLTARGDSEG
jgi:HEPN domain-containing protein